MKKESKTAEGYKPERMTAARAREIMLWTRNQTLTDTRTGTAMRWGKIDEDMKARIAAGEYRKPTRAELLSVMKDQCTEHSDKLACIDGMLGGLALMRLGAEHGDGWIRDGMEDALAEHFDAIEKILEAGRKIYAENVRTMKKAIA